MHRIFVSRFCPFLKPSNGRFFVSVNTHGFSRVHPDTCISFVIASLCRLTHPAISLSKILSDTLPVL